MVDQPADKTPEAAPVDPHVSGDAGAHPLHGLDNDEIATRAMRPPGSGTDPFKPDPHIHPPVQPQPRHTLVTGDGSPPPGTTTSPEDSPVHPGPAAKPSPRRPRVSAAAPAPSDEPDDAPKSETPFAAMLRRVREANGERITTTKAQWARVCADETADPMQLLELQHLVDQLDIYIVDR